MTAKEWLGVIMQAQDVPKEMEKLIIKYGEMLLAESPPISDSAERVREQAAKICDDKAKFAANSGHGVPIAYMGGCEDCADSIRQMDIGSADEGREKIEQKRRKKFDEMLAKMGEKEAAEFLDTLSKGLTDEGRESIEFADWLLRGDPQRVYQYDKPYWAISQFDKAYWSIRNSPLLDSEEAYKLFKKMRASNVKYMP